MKWKTFVDPNQEFQITAPRKSTRMLTDQGANVRVNFARSLLINLALADQPASKQTNKQTEAKA